MTSVRYEQSDFAGDQRTFFRETAKLLNHNTLQKLPSHSSLDDLTNKFADVFEDKILKIRYCLSTPTRNWKDKHALVLKSVHLAFLTLFLYLIMTLEKF